MGLRDAGHNKSRRLGMIATPLAPERAPWWVSEPGGHTPGQGWWWTPNGEQYPQFLAHNAAVAEAKLLEMLDAGLAP